MSEQELIARLVRKLPANAANHDTVYLSAVVADFLMEIRQHDKARYVEAIEDLEAEAEGWNDYEVRAYRKAIAAIEGVDDD
jgi:hypothetical protein